MSYIDGALIVIVVQANSTRIRGSAAVVEETPERELEEAVEGLAVVQQFVRLVRLRRLRVAQLLGIDGVEVARVRRILDARYVRRDLPTEALLEVDAREERVALDLVRVLAEATIRADAELQDEVHALRREIRLLRYVQCCLPVDHLQTNGTFPSVRIDRIIFLG